MVTFLCHPFFAVMPLLRENSDTNQGNIRNFTDYIITVFMTFAVFRFFALLNLDINIMVI